MFVDPRWIPAQLRLAVAASVLTSISAAASAQTCTQTLSPGANVAAAVSGAASGATVCLVAGSYGSVTLSGIVKNPSVTIRSASEQGAALALTISNGSSGIIIESVTVTGGSMSGSTTRNITIRKSKFTGAMTFNGLANANVLLDQNTHNSIEGGGQYVAPARLHLSYGSSTPSGVTIQNSVMDGGSADGVQTGVGVNILNNQFRNILEATCSGCHTDAIQLLGAPGSVIRGNYITNSSTGIVAYDGLSRATIENNVIDLGGRPWGIEIYSDSNSVVRHNTVVYRSGCAYSQACGQIVLDHKSTDPAGSGTVLVDNIATSISASNGSTYAERHHNLVRFGAASGDISGAPTYVGGSIPATLSGFQLASGSLGKGAAYDPAGGDVGALVATSTTPPPNAATDVRIIR